MPMIGKIVSFSRDTPPRCRRDGAGEASARFGRQFKGAERTAIGATDWSESDAECRSSS